MGPVSDPLPLPEGFAVGHWTDLEAGTGCTVVMAPGGTRGGVDVRGGGTGTRELEGLAPLANAEGPSAVLLTGGSAFGLAAADGVIRWLEERGLGRPTPVGPIPLVSAAVVFDAAAGTPGRRPGADEGYAACEAAVGGVPVRGCVGAGTGAAVGKMLGREGATRGGVGYAATRLGGGETLAALTVANSWGDVIGPDGGVLGGPRGERGEMLRTAEEIRDMPDLPGWAVPRDQSTTLVCVCTDAALDKRGCGIVARIAAAGIARAVDPAFTPFDGDIAFCLASGGAPPAQPGPAASWSLTVLGTAAATLTAAAIRDALGQPSEHRPR
jgi:L-aminopeptidase/D-esterase-like protein